jgi:predicted transposase/invertase (TIGR01784 family)
MQSEDLMKLKDELARTRDDLLNKRVASSGNIRLLALANGINFDNCSDEEKLNIIEKFITFMSGLQLERGTPKSPKKAADPKTVSPSNEKQPKDKELAKIIKAGKENISRKGNDIKSDIAFKVVMESPMTLTSFLNDLLSPTEPFTSVEYTNTEIHSYHSDGKSVRYDIVARLPNGDQVIIEMQKTEQRNFINRMAYYASMGLVSLKKGQDYNEMNRTIIVGILNFELFNDSSPVHQAFLTDAVTHACTSRTIELYTLELQKAKGSTIIERWMQLFNTPEAAEIESHPAILQAREDFYIFCADSNAILQHELQVVKQEQDFQQVIEETKKKTERKTYISVAVINVNENKCHTKNEAMENINQTSNKYKIEFSEEDVRMILQETGIASEAGSNKADEE